MKVIPWHFNTVLKVIEDETIKPRLHDLIAASVAPLGVSLSEFFRPFKGVVRRKEAEASGLGPSYPPTNSKTRPSSWTP